MILLINGSAGSNSSNGRLLEAMALKYSNNKERRLVLYDSDLNLLPLFSPDKDISPLHIGVQKWRQTVAKSQAMIISTPVYIYNIPAVLKNALEWLATSGELLGKPVLAMTYTPHPPRGEKAMTSLLQSLSALDARIVGQCSLYQNELTITEEKKLEGEGSIEILNAAIELLV